MKKFFLATLCAFFTVPAFATCAISGESCAFSIEPPSSIQSKYLPNRIEDIRKPDAFRPHYVKPYYDEMINTETGSASNIQNENNYNSNCQFGVCLPGANPSQK
ncbi:hypothetical protein J6A31_03275 [bacterium]|nr:hypothetical protein [bacterium]